jgi:hypothetical protein
MALDKAPRQEHGSAVGVDRVQAAAGYFGDGDDAAVVEALPAGPESAVYKDLVAGGITTFLGRPARASEFRAVDVTSPAKTGSDAVGEIFAIGVGDGERNDAGGAVGGDVGDGGVSEGFPGCVG